jgi:hypothetical protein
MKGNKSRALDLQKYIIKKRESTPGFQTFETSNLSFRRHKSLRGKGSKPINSRRIEWERVKSVTEKYLTSDTWRKRSEPRLDIRYKGAKRSSFGGSQSLEAKNSGPKIYREKIIGKNGGSFIREKIKILEFGGKKKEKNMLRKIQKKMVGQRVGKERKIRKIGCKFGNGRGSHSPVMNRYSNSAVKRTRSGEVRRILIFENFEKLKQMLKSLSREKLKKKKSKSSNKKGKNQQK